TMQALPPIAYCEVHVLVRGQLGAFGVGGPGVPRGGWRGPPGRVRCDDLEAVADGQAAVALRAVADVNVYERRRAARTACVRVEERALVLHSLMDQRDVRRAHA